MVFGLVAIISDRPGSHFGVAVAWVVLGQSRPAS